MGLRGGEEGNAVVRMYYMREKYIKRKQKNIFELGVVALVFNS